MLTISYLVKYPLDSFSVLVKLFPIVVMLSLCSYKIKSSAIFLKYLLFEFIVGCVMIYMASMKMNNLLVYNVSVYAGFGVLCFMFYNEFVSVSLRVLTLSIALIFYIVSTIDFILVGTRQSLRFSGTLECLFVIVLCLCLYRELLIQLKVRNLFDYPFFYISSGLLLYASSKTFVAPLFFFIDRSGQPLDFEIHLMIPSIIESVYLIFVGIGFLVSRS